eukprot:CAMPEP_0196656922 /NCGR_PEP_ID=MMETSP1086-20130531/20400_1 /TAXON_ID=77921 /ORGANISM="Cyanoptyche  gloeocystis , Strain SAG4.97" /LENGTH=247 /DNA_ID=CAMNT_0041989851 /DNA_START=72 /DNA_END=815 /DNA_ORIENTATION=+
MDFGASAVAFQASAASVSAKTERQFQQLAREEPNACAQQSRFVGAERHVGYFQAQNCQSTKLSMKSFYALKPISFSANRSDNVFGEFVILSKGGPMGAGMVPPPPTDQPEFYIFARSPGSSIWYPIGQFLGDRSAQVLVNAMRTGWSKKLYARTLRNRVAAVVYKEKSKMLKPALEKNPALRKYEDNLEFSFRVRMKDYAEDGFWLLEEPKKQNFVENTRDQFAEWFSKEDESKIDTSSRVGRFRLW